jgi:hypothetical protein
MSVDPLAEQAPSSSSGTRRKVLLNTSDIGLKSNREKDVY